MATSLFKINVSAIVCSDGKYFMIRRADDEEVFPGHWGIAGGTVETTDISLEDALIREFEEEVRATILPGRVISNNIVARNGKTVLYVVYDAEFIEGSNPVAGQDTAEVAWMTFEEACKLKLTPGTLEVLKDYDGTR